MKRSLDDLREEPPCKKTGLLEMPNEIIADIIKNVPRPAPLFYTCRRLYEFAHHMSAADAQDLVLWYCWAMKCVGNKPKWWDVTAKKVSEHFDDLYLATHIACDMFPEENFIDLYGYCAIVQRWAAGVQCDSSLDFADESEMWKHLLVNVVDYRSGGHWRTRLQACCKDTAMTRLVKIEFNSAKTTITASFATRYSENLSHSGTNTIPKFCKQNCYWLALVMLDILPPNLFPIKKLF